MSINISVCLIWWKLIKSCAEAEWGAQQGKFSCSLCIYCISGCGSACERVHYLPFKLSFCLKLVDTGSDASEWVKSLRWSSRTVSRNVQLIHTVTCQLWCNIELLVSDLCSFKKPQCIWQGRKVDCDSPNTFSCLCKGFFLVLSGMNYLPEALAFESQKGHLYSTQELFNRITLLLLNKI